MLLKMRDFKIMILILTNIMKTKFLIKAQRKWSTEKSLFQIIYKKLHIFKILWQILKIQIKIKVTSIHMEVKETKISNLITHTNINTNKINNNKKHQARALSI